jgi:hypothetical protein
MQSGVIIRNITSLTKMCGENAELLNVKVGDIHSHHCALKA